MAESAVTDRPATDTETEATAVTPTEDTELSVTEGDDAAAQTDAVATTEDDPDPHEVALAAAREAAIEEGRELARAELEEQRRRERDSESRRQLKEHYPNTVRAMETELASLGLEDPAARQKVLNHLSAYNLKVQEAILAPFEDAVQELIPASVRDDFNRAADGKPATDFQRTFAEFMAEHDPAVRSKVLKGVKLEDLEKSSPSLKAALTARDAANFDKGRAKGRTDPVGEASTETARAAAAAVPSLASWNAMKLEEREERRRKDPQIEARIAGLL